MHRIKITGILAHFKIPGYSKTQRTYEIPPIATVVGILKNIFGEDIDDFLLGYTIKYKSKYKDYCKIYKEFNMIAKTYTDKERFRQDTFINEYLYDVELVIYTDIEKEIVLEEPLVLGKANCLASLNIENVTLKNRPGKGHNQYTDINTGLGIIKRINTVTMYNKYKDMYDFKMALVRENEEFSYDKNYDEDYDENIFIWHWKGGEINAAN